MIDIQRPPKDPDSVLRTFLKQFVLVPLVSLIIARNTSGTNNTRTNTSWPVKVPLKHKSQHGQWKCTPGNGNVTHMSKYDLPRVQLLWSADEEPARLGANLAILTGSARLFSPKPCNYALSEINSLLSSSDSFFPPCNSALSFSSSSTLQHVRWTSKLLPAELVY